MEICSRNKKPATTLLSILGSLRFTQLAELRCKSILSLLLLLSSFHSPSPRYRVTPSLTLLGLLSSFCRHRQQQQPLTPLPRPHPSPRSTTRLRCGDAGWMACGGAGEEGEGDDGGLMHEWRQQEREGLPSLSLFSPFVRSGRPEKRENSTQRVKAPSSSPLRPSGPQNKSFG